MQGTQFTSFVQHEYASEQFPLWFIREKKFLFVVVNLVESVRFVRNVSDISLLFFFSVQKQVLYKEVKKIRTLKSSQICACVCVREREKEGWFKSTVCEKSLMNENVGCLDVAMYEEELSVLWFSGSHSQRSKNVLDSRPVCKSCCSKCSLHVCCNRFPL